MAVVSDTHHDGNYHEILSNWSFSNGGNSVFFGTSSYSPITARLSDSFASAGTITNPTNGFVFSGVSGSTDASTYENLSLLADKGSPLAARDLSSPFVIGRQGPIPEYWQGDISEILVYNRALTNAEIVQNTQYLAAEFSVPGITTPEPGSVALLCAAGLTMGGALVRRRRGTTSPAK